MLREQDDLFDALNAFFDVVLDVADLCIPAVLQPLVDEALLLRTIGVVSENLDNWPLA